MFVSSVRCKSIFRYLSVYWPTAARVKKRNSDCALGSMHANSPPQSLRTITGSKASTSYVGERNWNVASNQHDREVQKQCVPWSSMT
jgi:hypothetical protein